MVTNLVLGQLMRLLCLTIMEVLLLCVLESFPARIVSFKFANLFLVGNWKLLLVAACFAIFKQGLLPLELVFTFEYIPIVNT